MNAKAPRNHAHAQPALAQTVVARVLETDLPLSPKDLLRRASYWKLTIYGYNSGGTAEYFATEDDAHRYAKWWIAERAGVHPDQLTRQHYRPWLVHVESVLGTPPYPLDGPGSLIAYVNQHWAQGRPSESLSPAV